MALELWKPGSTFTVRDVDLVPDGDPETVYTCRYFTADDAERLRKQATKQKYNPTNQQMESSFDAVAYALSILDHVVMDWSGVVQNGEPLPCILQHKRILPASRRDKLLLLSQENVEVKAKQQAESFRETADVR